MDHLARIISEARQNEWLADPWFQPTVKERNPDSSLRAATAFKLARLRRNPDFDKIILLARKYVNRCLIEPRLTEDVFWRASCLPEAAIAIRFIVRKQEVFYIGANASYPLYYWQIKRSAFADSQLDNLLSRYAGLEYDDFAYPSGGEDQFRLIATNFETAYQLLDEPLFLKAAKAFNLERFRTGEPLNPKSHCFALADVLFVDD